MTQLAIFQFPCLKDNFGVLINDPETGATAAIDAPCAGAVTKALEETKWHLSHILVTHHHSDHTGGILALKAATNCEVIGPRAEAARIPGIDRAVDETDNFMFGRFAVRVLDTPGHTAGHICYFIPTSKVAFVGDTLFAMGCGRVLEGTPQQMWASLSKLATLPDDTVIYCGHEYALANARFGLAMEPDNPDLAARNIEVEALRAAGLPTMPTTLRAELETNVFLRVAQPSIRNRLNLKNVPDWEVFADLRERKNKF